jgi:hypothetical protein
VPTYACRSHSPASVDSHAAESPDLQVDVAWCDTWRRQRICLVGIEEEPTAPYMCSTCARPGRLPTVHVSPTHVTPMRITSAEMRVLASFRLGRDLLVGRPAEEAEDIATEGIFAYRAFSFCSSDKLATREYDPIHTANIIGLM